MEAYNYVAIAVLGWLAAILSQIIISHHGRQKRKLDIKRLMVSELKELAFRCIATYQRVQIHLGCVNKESLEWETRIFKKYGDESVVKLIEDLNSKLQRFGAEDIEKAASLTKAKNTVGLSLKRQGVFEDGVVISNILLFDEKVQKDLLEIRFLVNALNEEVESGMYFYKLTFNSSAMEKNASVILGNMKEVYKKIMKLNKDIVIKIDGFVEKDKKGELA